MAVSEKKTNRIPLNLGDADFLLLCKAAALDDRPLAEFVWARIVRPWLHGNSRLVNQDGNDFHSNFADLGGTER